MKQLISYGLLVVLFSCNRHANNWYYQMEDTLIITQKDSSLIYWHREGVLEEVIGLSLQNYYPKEAINKIQVGDTILKIGNSFTLTIKRGKQRIIVKPKPELE